MNIFPGHISFLISHVATATLLLRKKILPRKSYSNLKQLILFRLLNGLVPFKVTVFPDSNQTYASLYPINLTPRDGT